MGITVISTGPAALATAGAPIAGAAAGLAGSGLGGSGSGFAALLSGQLGTALGLDTKQPEASADDEDAPSIAVDPSLAFLLGNPAITPPLQPNLAATQLGNSLDKDLLGEKGSAAAGLTELLQSAGGKGEAATAAGKLALTAAAETPFGAAAGKDLPADTANIAVDTQASASASTASLLAAGNRTASANADVQPRSEVATPLHAANWSSDFGEKVVWLAKSEQQSAQLNINPPQLGPVQITLQLNGDQATAVFASPHAEVRQAIEDSLPQLREMLAGAGINLGQADIGANLARQQAEARFQAAAENRSSSENAILPAVGGTVQSTAGQPIQSGRGLVDLFA